MHSSFFGKKGKPILLAVSVLSILTAGMFAAGFLAGSGSKGMAYESDYERYNSGFVVAQPGSYDSADIAVIREIDTEQKKITFMNIETGKYYTLNYDGTTVIADKYGNGMAMAQMNDGDIVDVTFLRSKKKLSGMKLSDSAWVMENVEKYSFDLLRKSAEVGSGVYSLRNNLVVSSEGKDAQLEDIIRGDVVSVSGVGNSVYSVVVEEGHGYLRLSANDYLKGGWIEVGQAVIQRITEDMLLVVPEGSYNVRLTAGGIDEVRQVTIYRNQEVTLDVNGLEPEAPKVGKIVFAISPSDATVLIDGEQVDISGPVEVEYGVHQVMVRAQGYETVTQYIRVGQELASISITLDKEEENASGQIGNSVSNNSVSGNSLELTASDLSSFKIYIQSPAGVEVYWDGVYKGLSPVSFKKEAGLHTVTLRKPGYVTKSYTVQIDEEEKDVTYSFSSLIKEDTKTVSGNSSVSGNGSVSGNNSSSNDDSSSNNNNTLSGNTPSKSEN